MRTPKNYSTFYKLHFFNRKEHNQSRTVQLLQKRDQTEASAHFGAVDVQSAFLRG